MPRSWVRIPENTHTHKMYLDETCVFYAVYCFYHRCWRFAWCTDASWTDTTVQSRCRKHRHHQSFEPLDVFLLFRLHINHWNGETGEMLEVGEAGRGRLEVCVPGHNPSVWNDSTGKHPYSTSSAPLNIHGWFLRGQCVCVRLRVRECVFVSV